MEDRIPQYSESGIPHLKLYINLEKTRTFQGEIYGKKKNVQKNHKTIIELSNIVINSGVSDSKFTERMMTRGL